MLATLANKFLLLPADMYVEEIVIEKNRLKLLKRHMYGRANFDLLRLRALHAA